MADGMILVIDRQGVEVTADGDTLRIRDPHGGSQKTPLRLIESVAIHGNAMVRCDVWRKLAEHNIPAALLPVRGHEQTAWLGSGLNATLPHRQAQHRTGPELAINIARHLVARKTANTRALLQELSAQTEKPAWRGAPPNPTKTLERIDATRKKLDACPDPASLMGREGAVANAWFGWLGDALQPHWKFSGRNRRPPRDPLNALLSLGYSLLGSEVQQAVMLCGLDPALGFLHQQYPGRNALVLDCMEPLRAGVDALSINLLDSVLKPEHFSSRSGEGCRLTKEGRALYYPYWAAYRSDWMVYDGRIADGEHPRTLRSQCLREVKQLRRLLRPERNESAFPHDSP